MGADRDDDAEEFVIRAADDLHGEVHLRRLLRDSRSGLGSDRAAEISSTIKAALREAFEIDMLSVGDRAELDQLIAAANAAPEQYAPVLDTPVGVSQFSDHMQSLLAQAQALVAPYANRD